MSVVGVLCSFLLLLFASCVQTNSQLPLNPQAALLSDVSSVHHNLTSHHVIINLARNRRCVQPTFMVRLSGRSLYLLDLVHNNHTKPETVVFHYPHLPEAGTYFLEVISMYCETLNPNAFTNMCLIHPLDSKNVLTLSYTFQEGAEAEISNIRRPRWVLQRNETPVLLPTRYQKMCGATFCVSKESEIAQHNKYEWTDKPPYRHLIKKTLEWGKSNITHPTGNESISICMVGASHAATILISGLKLNISGVNFAYIPSRYPQLFDVSLLANCTYAVVGYGQWPLSTWMGLQPYNAERYESLMRTVLSTVKAANLRTQVFTRSMNLNSLGYRHTGCPTSDYRHPPLVMMYNSIMARLSAEYNIPYIDMFHLQGPLWDAALDWSHPPASVATAEAEYIIHSVLSYSHTFHRAPVLEPNFPSRILYGFNPVLVRFTDSDTVYVLVGNKFRALPEPSSASLLHLGCKDEPVRSVDAIHKLPNVIGPMLVEI